MTLADPTKLSFLRELPRRDLTPEQQLEAVKKVQAQAEQRVKLGMQLFKAAESRINAQQDLVDQFRKDQDTLKEQVLRDVAKTLQEYDQWIGRIDESFTHAIQSLEQRLDALEQSNQSSLTDVKRMVERSEEMLDHTRVLIEGMSWKGAVASGPAAHAVTPAEPASSGEPRSKPAAVRPRPMPDGPRVPPPPAATDAPPTDSDPAMHEHVADIESDAPRPMGVPLPPPPEVDENAVQNSTEQEKVYSRLLDHLRREAEGPPNSEAA